MKPYIITEGIVQRLRRGISLVTCIVFLQTTLTSPAQASLSAIPEESIHVRLPADFASIQLPSEIGKIDDVFNGQTSTRVIVVQDAHAIPDAQRSIRKTILYFYQRYGISLVALEGASAALDAHMLKSFPDKERLNKVLSEYFDQGELAGGTAAAIAGIKSEDNSAAGTRLVFQGVEDWPVYEEALRLYLSAMGKEKEVLEELKVRSSKLEEEKKKQYGTGLLKIDRAIRAFRANSSDFLKTLKVLAEIKAPAVGSELALLLEQAEKETRGGVTQDNSAEVRGLSAKVEKFFLTVSTSAETKTLRNEFQAKKQEFQTSQITPEAFALSLKTIAARAGIPIQVSDQLLGLVQKEKRMTDIEGTKLFADFESYAQSVKESLFKTEQDRELDRRDRRLWLAHKLAKLEVSYEDWVELQKMQSEGTWQVDGLKMNSLETLFGAHFAFYRNAQKRDEILFKNLRVQLKNIKAAGNSAVMVAGGFHAHGLCSLLKENGISYALVMPEIKTMPEESHYREQIRGDFSWRNYFEVENGKVSIYKAFIRSTRDRLLNNHKSQDANYRDEEANPRILKNWRDQIIRDLADEGRIEKAGDYTHFIDELTGDGKSQGIKKRLAQVDRFLDGLTKLDADGKFTAANIAKLFPGATVSTLTGVALDPRAVTAVQIAEGVADGLEAPQPLSPAVPVSAKPTALPEEAAAVTQSSQVKRSEVRNLDGKAEKSTISKDELLFVKAALVIAAKSPVVHSLAKRLVMSKTSNITPGDVSSRNFQRDRQVFKLESADQEGAPVYVMTQPRNQKIIQNKNPALISVSEVEFEHGGEKFIAQIFIKPAKADEAVALLAGEKAGYQILLSIEEDYLAMMRSQLSSRYVNEGGLMSDVGRGYQKIVTQRLLERKQLNDSISLYADAGKNGLGLSISTEMENILSKVKAARGISYESPLGIAVAYRLSGKPNATEVIDSASTAGEAVVGIALAIQGAVEQSANLRRHPTDYYNFLVPESVFLRIKPALEKDPSLLLNVIRARSPDTSAFLFDRPGLKGSLIPVTDVVGVNSEDGKLKVDLGNLNPVDSNDRNQMVAMQDFGAAVRSEVRNSGNDTITQGIAWQNSFINPEDRKAAQWVLETTHVIKEDEFMAGLKSSVEIFLGKINGRPFNVILSPQLERGRSRQWVSELVLKRIGLGQNKAFKGAVTPEEFNINSSNDASIKDIVIIDDFSATGMQMQGYIAHVRSSVSEDVRIHVIVPFITNPAFKLATKMSRNTQLHTYQKIESLEKIIKRQMLKTAVLSAKKMAVQWGGLGLIMALLIGVLDAMKFRSAVLRVLEVKSEDMIGMLLTSFYHKTPDEVSFPEKLVKVGAVDKVIPPYSDLYSATGLLTKARANLQPNYENQRIEFKTIEPGTEKGLFRIKYAADGQLYHAVIDSEGRPVSELAEKGARSEMRTTEVSDEGSAKQGKPGWTIAGVINGFRDLRGEYVLRSRVKEALRYRYSEERIKQIAEVLVNVRRHTPQNRRELIDSSEFVQVLTERINKGVGFLFDEIKDKELAEIESYLKAVFSAGFTAEDMRWHLEEDTMKRYLMNYRYRDEGGAERETLLADEAAVLKAFPELAVAIRQKTLELSREDSENAADYLTTLRNLSQDTTITPDVAQLIGSNYLLLLIYSKGQYSADAVDLARHFLAPENAKQKALLLSGAFEQRKSETSGKYESEGDYEALKFLMYLQHISEASIEFLATPSVKAVFDNLSRYMQTQMLTTLMNISSQRRDVMSDILKRLPKEEAEVYLGRVLANQNDERSSLTSPQFVELIELLGPAAIKTLFQTKQKVYSHESFALLARMLKEEAAIGSVADRVKKISLSLKDRPAVVHLMLAWLSEQSGSRGRKPRLLEDTSILGVLESLIQAGAADEVLQSYLSASTDFSGSSYGNLPSIWRNGDLIKQILSLGDRNASLILEQLIVILGVGSQDLTGESVAQALTRTRTWILAAKGDKTASQLIKSILSMARVDPNFNASSWRNRDQPLLEILEFIPDGIGEEFVQDVFNITLNKKPYVLDPQFMRFVVDKIKSYGALFVRNLLTFGVPEENYDLKGSEREADIQSRIQVWKENFIRNFESADGQELFKAMQNYQDRYYLVKLSTDPKEGLFLSPSAVFSAMGSANFSEIVSVIKEVRTAVLDTNHPIFPQGAYFESSHFMNLLLESPAAARRMLSLSSHMGDFYTLIKAENFFELAQSMLSPDSDNPTAAFETFLGQLFTPELMKQYVTAQTPVDIMHWYRRMLEIGYGDSSAAMLKTMLTKLKQYDPGKVLELFDFFTGRDRRKLDLDVFIGYAQDLGLRKSSYLFGLYEAMTQDDFSAAAKAGIHVTGTDPKKKLKEALAQIKKMRRELNTYLIQKDALPPGILDNPLQMDLLRQITNFDGSKWARNNDFARLVAQFLEDQDRGMTATVPILDEQGREIKALEPLANRLIKKDKATGEVQRVNGTIKARKLAKFNFGIDDVKVYDQVKLEIEQALSFFAMGDNPQRNEAIRSLALKFAADEQREIDQNREKNRNNPKAMISVEQRQKKLEPLVSALQKENLSFSDLIAILGQYDPKNNLKANSSLLRTLLFTAGFEVETSGAEQAREKLGQLGEISIDGIAAFLEFTGNIIKQHVLVENQAHREGRLDFNEEMNKKLGKYLNFSPLHTALKQAQAAKEDVWVSLTVMPTRGILAELSGYFADACWTRQSNIVRDNPHMTAFVILENAEDPDNVDIVGASLLLSNTIDGQPAQIIRGFNPQDGVINRLSAADLLDSFIDYLRTVPKEKEDDPEDILLIPAASSGAASNRPQVLDAMREIQKGESLSEDGGEAYQNISPRSLDILEQFNNYDITHNVFVVPPGLRSPLAKTAETTEVARSEVRQERNAVIAHDDLIGDVVDLQALFASPGMTEDSKRDLLEEIIKLYKSRFGQKSSEHSKYDEAYLQKLINEREKMIYMLRDSGGRVSGFAEMTRYGVEGPQDRVYLDRIVKGAYSVKGSGSFLLDQLLFQLAKRNIPRVYFQIGNESQGFYERYFELRANKLILDRNTVFEDQAYVGFSIDPGFTPGPDPAIVARENEALRLKKENLERVTSDLNEKLASIQTAIAAMVDDNDEKSLMALVSQLDQDITALDNQAAQNQRILGSVNYAKLKKSIDQLGPDLDEAIARVTSKDSLTISSGEGRLVTAKSEVRNQQTETLANTFPHQVTSVKIISDKQGGGQIEAVIDGNTVPMSLISSEGGLSDIYRGGGFVLKMDRYGAGQASGENEAKISAAIRAAKAKGISVGGVVDIVAHGLTPLTRVNGDEGGGRYVLLMNEFPNAIDFKDRYNKAPSKADFKERIGALNQAVTTVQGLFNLGIAPGDLKGRNLLVNDLGEAKLIDLGSSLSTTEPAPGDTDAKPITLETFLGGRSRGYSPTTTEKQALVDNYQKGEFSREELLRAMAVFELYKFFIYDVLYDHSMRKEKGFDYVFTEEKVETRVRELFGKNAGKALKIVSDLKGLADVSGVIKGNQNALDEFSRLLSDLSALELQGTDILPAVESPVVDGSEKNILDTVTLTQAEVDSDVAVVGDANRLTPRVQAILRSYIRKGDFQELNKLAKGLAKLKRHTAFDSASEEISAVRQLYGPGAYKKLSADQQRVAYQTFIADLDAYDLQVVIDQLTVDAFLKEFNGDHRVEDVSKQITAILKDRNFATVEPGSLESKVSEMIGKTSLDLDRWNRIEATLIEKLKVGAAQNEEPVVEGAVSRSELRAGKLITENFNGALSPTVNELIEYIKDGRLSQKAFFKNVALRLEEMKSEPGFEVEDAVRFLRNAIHVFLESAGETNTVDKKVAEQMLKDVLKLLDPGSMALLGATYGVQLLGNETIDDLAAIAKGFAEQLPGSENTLLVASASPELRRNFLNELHRQGADPRIVQVKGLNNINPGIYLGEDGQTKIPMLYDADKQQINRAELVGVGSRHDLTEIVTPADMQIAKFSAILVKVAAARYLAFSKKSGIPVPQLLLKAGVFQGVNLKKQLSDLFQVNGPRELVISDRAMLSILQLLTNEERARSKAAQAA